MSLAGQRIVVIGGTSGLGFAVARAAQEAKATVHIASRSGAKLDAALAQLDAEATGGTLDVTDDQSVNAFFEATGAFDHLIYTAGDWVRRRNVMGEKFSVEEAAAGFDTRFWGALSCVKAALPFLAATGSITLTAGVLAHRPQKGQAMSTALAGAMEHLTQGLSVDLAPIRVNCVTPGLIATEAWAALPAETMTAMTKDQPPAPSRRRGGGGKGVSLLYAGVLYHRTIRRGGRWTDVSIALVSRQVRGAWDNRYSPARRRHKRSQNSHPPMADPPASGAPNPGWLYTGGQKKSHPPAHAR